MTKVIYFSLFILLLLHGSYGDSGLDGYHIINSLSHIYKLQTSPKAWTDARDTCDSEGAVLFYPQDQDEATDVLAYVEKRKGIDHHIWIGLYFASSRALYTVDGLTTAYTPWASNEPNNAHNNEYCVELHHEGVNDLHCNFEKPYICKKPISVLTGPQGIQGLPGQKGDRGIQGSLGLQGYPGMTGVKGDMGVMGPQGIQGLPGQKGDRGIQGSPGLQGYPGMTGVKGDMGDMGPQGIQGLPGPQGDQGIQGPPGTQGLPGQKGERGFDGSPGKQGIKGERGYTGLMGAPGAPGSPGSPGLPGVCPATCPVIYIHEDPINAEGIPSVLGSQERPSSAICKFMPASNEEVATPDPYWVMEEETFPVKCDKTTNRTCLMLKHNDTEWINENKILIGNTQKGMWLSKSGLSLTRFNTITRNQMNWLKDQSSSASQMIRLYFINSKFESLNLRLLNSYDVPIGQSPSASTPMYYTVEKHDDDQVEINGETWKYVDLVIIDEAKRLPVVDFYVEYVPDNVNDANISVQLRELCFG